MITIDEQVGVAYAYPSSPQAVAMGRGRSGTWYVQNGMDYILADGPGDANAICNQMVAGGYHRSMMCMTHAATWGDIIARHED